MTKDKNDQSITPETPANPETIPDAKAEADRLRSQGLANQAHMPRSFGK